MNHNIFIMQAVFITKITPGGLAEKDGRLKAGDCIVSVS